jgi:hypothetical protein
LPSQDTIRLLNGLPPAEKPRRKWQQWTPTYDSRTVSILKAVWEATDCPWSARLKALLAEWMPWIRRRFRLTPKTEGQLPRDQPSHDR